MPATYEPIATTTLGSATATITFSSIPSTYTDLRVVLVSSDSTDGSNIRLRFNGDTASNYSDTQLLGDGTSATSDASTSSSYIRAGYQPTTSGPKSFTSVDIFSYVGSTFKTALTTCSNDQNGSGKVSRNVGLWRSTAAITSVTFTAASNYDIGTTATIYGILKA